MAIPQEAFLSHSSQDQKFVVALAEELRRHGVPVWYSQTNILGAQQWHDEIGAASRVRSGAGPWAKCHPKKTLDNPGGIV